MSASTAPFVPSTRTLEVPRQYNAAAEFIDSHIAAGRTEKIAVIDDAGNYTYGELAEKVNRAGHALKSLGLRPESRVAMLMSDSLNFPAVFWGAIKVGFVPIPVNTLLKPEDYRHIIGDSRAQAVIIDEALLNEIRPALANQPFLEHIVVDGEQSGETRSLSQLLADAPAHLEPAATTCDDVAFWLYSSGSTGAPKGVKHLHRNLRATSEYYAKGVLGIREDDVIFSAAKLFFAYGLGNGMTFPFSVGATAVYTAARPTPQTIIDIFSQHQPTLFAGVPTLFASILSNEENNRESGSKRLRCCLSAGEALPAEVGKRWEKRFGAPILDGVGSTEMLHIFLSNQPGKVRYGTSGTPVPGYHAKLMDDEGGEVPNGEIGELWINGPSAAECYWNQREKSLNTFAGPWTRTGDKYYQDEEGFYHYCGRADDMMKVSGNWASPFEIESILIEKERVLEAAVIAHRDKSSLVKPKAYVVLRDDVQPTRELSDELKAFVKSRLPRWKYPRWIEFIDALPKTATGKIQRFRLRQLDKEHS